MGPRILEWRMEGGDLQISAMLGGRQFDGVLLPMPGLECDTPLCTTLTLCAV